MLVHPAVSASQPFYFLVQRDDSLESGRYLFDWHICPLSWNGLKRCAHEKANISMADHRAAQYTTERPVWGNPWIAT
jgi:hypothetical protein